MLAVLEPLVCDRGRDVLLLGHSSGGWVATEVARPDLQAPARKARGLGGGVVGILYAGAFVIPVGESIHSFVQPKDGTWDVLHAAVSTVSCTVCHTSLHLPHVLSILCLPLHSSRR